MMIGVVLLSVSQLNLQLIFSFSASNGAVKAQLGSHAREKALSDYTNCETLVLLPFEACSAMLPCPSALPPS